MIDELELLKTIISQLTGAGIWAMVAYISYSLLKVVFTLWAFLWFLNGLINKLFSYFKDTRVTKYQYEQVKSELEESKREVQSVIHKYKIMKESLKGEGDE